MTQDFHKAAYHRFRVQLAFKLQFLKRSVTISFFFLYFLQIHSITLLDKFLVNNKQIVFSNTTTDKHFFF